MLLKSKNVVKKGYKRLIVYKMRFEPEITWRFVYMRACETKQKDLALLAFENIKDLTNA